LFQFYYFSFIIFALFSIIDICKLICVYVKGVILNEDLMMMMTTTTMTMMMIMMIMMESLLGKERTAIIIGLTG